MLRTILNTTLLMVLAFSAPIFSGEKDLGAMTFDGHLNTPRLPKSRVEKDFVKMRKEFAWRWDRFKENKSFSPWNRNKTSDEVAHEMMRIYDRRVATMLSNLGEGEEVSSEDYIVSQDLYQNGHYRVPNCISYEYNRTCPTFNSSNLSLYGLDFMAMEGTREENQQRFFNMLWNYHVSHLVRVTGSVENGVDKCHPYWNNRISTTLDTQGKVHNHLMIPRKRAKDYPIAYFAKGDWGDYKGLKPEDLIQLVKEVRESYNPKDGYIGVHCSAGVGRTGTFITAYIVMDQIDKQVAAGKKQHEIEVPLEEIVSKLSLQRPYCVGSIAQYQCLHQMVGLYIEQTASRV